MIMCEKHGARITPNGRCPDCEQIEVKGIGEFLSDGQMDYMQNVAEFRAAKVSEHLDRYALGLIKKKPGWMPEWLYRFQIRQLFELAFFEKTTKEGRYEFLSKVKNKKLCAECAKKK